MRRVLLWAAVLLVALPTVSFGGIIGSIDPNLFRADTIDWCANFGCKNDYFQFATPQPWISNLGKTGMVGLVDTQQAFLNLQQGVTWNGNFASRMGLIYNAASFGNTPTDIAITFDEGQSGVGAYIQSNYFGAFTAAVTAFDVNYQPLFTYAMPGFSDSTPGTALFMGVLDDNPEIWALQFHAVGIGPAEPDFAIGSVGFAAPIPEPSTLVLLGIGLLGVPALMRGRKR